MNCLNPVRILNPKTRYVFDDLRGSFHDRKIYIDLMPIYERVVSRLPEGEDPYLDVACGKCEACLTRKSNEWAFRLFHEWNCSENAYFVTLTYHDGSLPRLKTGEPCFSKRDCQLFIKRLRKKFGNGIRYFLVSEYGSDRGRPHYHCLLFNFHYPKDNVMWQFKLEQELADIWKLGNVKCDEVIDERIIYCSKYCLSSLDWVDVQDQSLLYLKKYYDEQKVDGYSEDECRKRTLKNFILSSRKPGIGTQFLTDEVINYYIRTLDLDCKLKNGISYPMARFYKQKIFDEQQRADIAFFMKQNRVEASSAEKEAYINRIRKKFKKSHNLSYNDGSF